MRYWARLAAVSLRKLIPVVATWIRLAIVSLDYEDGEVKLRIDEQYLTDTLKACSGMTEQAAPMSFRCYVILASRSLRARLAPISSAVSPSIISHLLSFCGINRLSNLACLIWGGSTPSS